MIYGYKTQDIASCKTLETKWTKCYAMTSLVIAYRSLELLFGMHAFHFNCFFEDFNCVFTQIRCLSRVLPIDFFLEVPLFSVIRSRYGGLLNLL